MREEIRSTDTQTVGCAADGAGDEELTRVLSSYRAKGIPVPPRRLLKSPEQIRGIRESGRVNAAVLDAVAELVADGITTRDIDRLVREKTLSLGGRPAPLGYQGFPAAVCVSVNDEVCHGIPGSRTLNSGDIVNIDVSTVYGGYYSDASRMFGIGSVSEENWRLCRTAKECMEAGVNSVQPWAHLGDVGAAVGKRAQESGFSVAEMISGHGVGLAFHEEPLVSFGPRLGSGILMVPGMVFTVEPAVNGGSPDVFLDGTNGWTIRTTDGMPSAQWERTVCVTERGCEVLAW